MEAGYLKFKTTPSKVVETLNKIEKKGGELGARVGDSSCVRAFVQQTGGPGFNPQEKKKGSKEERKGEEKETI
jgi:hypothetical protein